MAIDLDRAICYNCRHVMFAHSAGWGCSQEERVEVPADSGIFEYAACGCASPEPSSPYNDQFWFEYEVLIVELAKILGITWWSASEVLWKSINYEGYQYG